MTDKKPLPEIKACPWNGCEEPGELDWYSPAEGPVQFQVIAFHNGHNCSGDVCDTPEAAIEAWNKGVGR
jgi:hypothetical protein